jgi:hypothetical protein
MAAFLGLILFWIGRLAAVVAAGLAIYIAFDPAVAGPYGRALGMFVMCIFGAAAWLIGGAARYILRGDR